MKSSLQAVLRSPWIVMAIVLSVCVIATQAQVRWAYEDLTYTVRPTAERAFAIAERSFSATTPDQYNFARAERYFHEAEKMNPEMPYLYHELARVAFLQGNLATAYARISLEIQRHGDSQPRSYYIRGLIAGYMQMYDQAADDFIRFAALQKGSWAGANDLAWVLIKAGRATEAVEVTEKALAVFPNNPWLLNSNAIALAEVGDLEKSRSRIQTAAKYALQISEQDWLYAYPGNDPRVAVEGIHALQTSILHTTHILHASTSTLTLQ